MGVNFFYIYSADVLFPMFLFNMFKYILLVLQTVFPYATIPDILSNVDYFGCVRIS